MKIRISPRAEKQLRKTPKIDQIALAKKIRSLTASGIRGREKLKGYAGVYRVRVGDYRVVYKRTGSEIYIILIGHRKDIYRLLEKLLS